MMENLALRGGDYTKKETKRHIFTAEEVKQIMAIANMQPISLDKPVKNEEETDAVLGDFIPYTGPSVDDVVENSDTNRLLMKYVDKLAPREKIIILMRYGFTENGSSKTLEEIGDHFGLTRERIRQIEQKALRKLRAYMARDKITLHDI